MTFHCRRERVAGSQLALHPGLSSNFFSFSARLVSCTLAPFAVSLFSLGAAASFFSSIVTTVPFGVQDPGLWCMA